MLKNSTVTQWDMGKHLFPVQVWEDIITRLDLYPGSSYDTPVKPVWVENPKKTITSQMTTKSLSSGKLSFVEEYIRFYHKEVGTHSLQSGFSMEIFLSRLYPKKT